VSLPAGVLIVGVYGTGKTSVCEEIAHLLETSGAAYGAIDLDWLGWYSVPGQTSGSHDHEWLDPVALSNLETVVRNYVAAGVEHVILAGSVWSRTELTALRAALPLPIRVVQLTLPFEEIEKRLSTAVTAGRAEDLQAAARQADLVRASPPDAVVADVLVANDRPIRAVAQEIIDWLGWR
jgi:gluconate kinase